MNHSTDPTPAPWYRGVEFPPAKGYGLTSVISVHSGGEVIAHVNCGFGRGEANARLITAAPKLLAAARAALSLAWEVGSETEDGVGTLLEDSRGDLWRQLTAAISDAEGR